MGQWEELGTDWWETNVQSCPFCGEMMPGKQWVSVQDGQRRVFHSPECEQLWLDYWVPKHGHTYPTVSGGRTRT